MVREASGPIAKYTDDSKSSPTLSQENGATQDAKGPELPQVFVLNNSPLKIWLALKIPTRKTFCDMIEVFLSAETVDSRRAVED